VLYLEGGLEMPLRVRWYNSSLFPRPGFSFKRTQHQARMYGTYRRQKLHHGITWLSTDAQPILYPVHAPFDALMLVVGFDPRSVNTQEFDRFRVPSLSLVDCDKVEDSVMSDPMYGESQTDGHGGRNDLYVVTCHPSSRSNS
jgi:hypothetical protein